VGTHILCCPPPSPFPFAFHLFQTAQTRGHVRHPEFTMFSRADQISNDVSPPSHFLHNPSFALYLQVLGRFVMNCGASTCFAAFYESHKMRHPCVPL